MRKYGEYYIRDKKKVYYHHRSHTPEYIAWDAMIARCTRPTNPYYENYGAKGITVYPSWRKSFQAFYNYMGDKPSSSHSLDRIDSSKNYEPGNVRWATKLQQSLNQKIRSDNSSGYRGVRFNKAMHKWSAEISVNGKNIYLGCHATAEDAAWVRDQAAMQLWGNDAKLNIN